MSTLVAFLVGRGACGTFLGIGDSHDDLLGHLLATLFLTHALQQAEGDGRLGGGTALGDVDDAEAYPLEVSHEFAEVVLTDVVAGKEDAGITALLQPAETVAQGIDDHACAQVASADTGYYDGITVLLERLGRGVDFLDEGRRDAAGQVHPAQEIVAGAGALLKCFLCSGYGSLELLNLTGSQERGCLCNV